MRALPFPLKSSSTLLSKNSKRKKINLSALFPGMMGKKKIQLADGTELDLSKMHYSDLEAMIKTPVDRLRSFVLAWCLDGKTIGHSSLKDIVPGEFGSIHLHTWRADLRGKGYGPRLFCLSALDFYERFNLKQIICEPKADNPMANRMLQRIGFPLVFTHVAAGSELSVVCELNRYEILRDIAERYLLEQTGRLKES